jgi:hypothetical protein
MTEISVCLKERFRTAKLLISSANIDLIYQYAGKSGQTPILAGKAPHCSLAAI